MCRHAAYTGPPMALRSILADLDHSLYHQAYQARELLTGVVCADGYGVGWYAPDQGLDAARYTFPGPIWSDPNLDGFTSMVQAPMLMAAVRNATVAGQNTHDNCAPFASGRHLASLNGFLNDFDASWRDGLMDALPPERRRAIQGSTDGEAVFQTILAELERHDGPSALATAVQHVCRDLVQQGQEAGLPVQLNWLVSDGEQVVATRCGSGPSQNSLYVLRDGEEFPGGIVLASEPLYDDPAWEPVAPDSVVVATAGAPLVHLTV